MEIRKLIAWVVGNCKGAITQSTANFGQHWQTQIRKQFVVFNVYISCDSIECRSCKSLKRISRKHKVSIDLRKSWNAHHRDSFQRK
ncbi:hypothetical protein M7I_0299 [Glarea lozoyensis 74030]|uniref:Uncharacterized protein n=1 Tax=Glarea lozoyensis (strain ATCC 74030 / MF5533) TaxID=1104152 RepID=H0ED01_GLAL7|nr:hypothetical protein M7I_0299 [Glarea lozoyensis 74030]